MTKLVAEKLASMSLVNSDRCTSGKRSCWVIEEQVAYTFSDVGAKLLHSSFLMSLRRQRNLHELSALRRVGRRQHSWCPATCAC